MTTLEEVFIKVNEEVEGKDGKPEEKEVGSDSFFAQENRDHRGSSINRRERAGNQIEEEKKSDEFNEESLHGSKISSNQDSSENLVGKGTLWASITALLTKRFHLYKRDRCGLRCELIVPIVLVLLGLVLVNIDFLKN